MSQVNKDLTVNGAVVDNTLCTFTLMGKGVELMTMDASEIESFSYEVADNGSSYINSMSGQPAVYDDKGVSISGTMVVFDSLQKKLNDKAHSLGLQNLVDFGRNSITYPCVLIINYVLNTGEMFTIKLNDIKFEKYGYNSSEKKRTIPFKALQELHKEGVITEPKKN